MSYADRLNKAMEDAGIIQADLVKITNIGKGQLSRYMSGMFAPKTENSNKLARALHVSPIWLLQGIGDMHMSEEEALLCQMAQEYADNQQIIDIWEQLTEDKKTELINYAKYLLNR